MMKNRIWAGTKESYDAFTNKDADTDYNVVSEETLLLLRSKLSAEPAIGAGGHKYMNPLLMMGKVTKP